MRRAFIIIPVSNGPLSLLFTTWLVCYFLVLGLGFRGFDSYQMQHLAAWMSSLVMALLFCMRKPRFFKPLWQSALGLCGLLLVALLVLAVGTRLFEASTETGRTIGQCLLGGVFLQTFVAWCRSRTRQLAAGAWLFLVWTFIFVVLDEKLREFCASVQVRQAWFCLGGLGWSVFGFWIAKYSPTWRDFSNSPAAPVLAPAVSASEPPRSSLELRILSKALLDLSTDPLSIEALLVERVLLPFAEISELGSAQMRGDIPVQEARQGASQVATRVNPLLSALPSLRGRLQTSPAKWKTQGIAFLEALGEEMTAYRAAAITISRSGFEDQTGHGRSRQVGGKHGAISQPSRT